MQWMLNNKFKMKNHFSLPNSGHNFDAKGSKLGMWLFLFTELLLFGGLFLTYLVYRNLYHEAFLQSSFHLNKWAGFTNTIVLLTSSMTVAMSIVALKKGAKNKAIWLLALTIIAAGIFMVIKYFEWSVKFEHGLFPGMDHYMSMEPGEKIYFFLYFFMTGLHGLHVIIGAVFIAVVIKKIANSKVNKDRVSLHENAGLYWHLVDLVWIYLFPLFYLIR